MAQIVNLKILNFRNLQSTSIQPGSHFNIFLGNNGAGKTSILEAIYYFGFGRSFRTSQPLYLIHKNSKQFLLHTELNIKNDITPVGIEYHSNTNRRIHFNGDNIKTISPIAELLPIQLISTDNCRFFHEGPKLRRQFMNWGLFHMEPRFSSLWQRLLRILKQRNATLKSRLPHKELLVWNTELLKLSEEINELCKKYIRQLKPIFNCLINSTLNAYTLDFNYYPGWNPKIDFETALNQNYSKDQLLGYTSVGPHRADIKLLIENKPAKEALSQGEQKFVSYILYLAQGQLLQTISSKKPIYLIDDLPSELDTDKCSHILSILAKTQAQIFITSINQQKLHTAIALKNTQLFHVEHNIANLLTN